MVQPQTTSIPNNGSGTINIHINNPSVGMGGSMPAYQMPCAYPMYYPYFAYPANYYMGQMGHSGGINQNMTINGLYPNGNGNANGANNAQDSNTKRNISETVISKETIKEPAKQREIVILTDNYIKNLENYLRSNNIELRKNAVNEILMRFKEDKSRLNNPSLTALLNIALQDPNSVVRSVAMATLGAGYAKGDAQTEQLLRGLQTQKNNFSSDAVQASESLLQMSKTKTKVTDNSHYLDQPPVVVKTQEKGGK